MTASNVAASIVILTGARFFAAMRLRLTVQRWDVMIKQYYVYIMASKSQTLYTGVTSNLERRVYQHKRKLLQGFTARYNITRLVYFEVTQDIHAAIAREKQIKGWLRAKKITLIESVNPEWRDLSMGWYEAGDSSGPGAPSE